MTLAPAKAGGAYPDQVNAVAEPRVYPGQVNAVAEPGC
jgi:hypothetical protein